ncbi:MAG: tryptophan-rich sensory protein [Candidatus Aminicenantes bacterium]|nr:MAG: tryptophan-rich sensory protein [Candidatus Aminicenantes bacterium]
MSNKLIKIIFSLLICQLAGVIGAIFNSTAVKTWYAHINKPGFTPPNWVFGPVWITLYLLMGISLFLVWNSDTNFKVKQTAMILFFIQLILNTLWSYFFFYLQSPLYGLIEIIILLIFIILTMLRFYAIRPLAAFLLVPYALWVGFATVLNYFLWQLNR